MPSVPRRWPPKGLVRFLIDGIDTPARSGMKKPVELPRRPVLGTLACSMDQS